MRALEEHRKNPCGSKVTIYQKTLPAYVESVCGHQTGKGVKHITNAISLLDEMSRSGVVRVVAAFDNSGHALAQCEDLASDEHVSTGDFMKSVIQEAKERLSWVDFAHGLTQPKVKEIEKAIDKDTELWQRVCSLGRHVRNAQRWGHRDESLST